MLLAHHCHLQNARWRPKAQSTSCPLMILQWAKDLRLSSCANPRQLCTYGTHQAVCQGGVGAAGKQQIDGLQCTGRSCLVQRGAAILHIAPCLSL
jgi:hypothetical protein